MESLNGENKNDEQIASASEQQLAAVNLKGAWQLLQESLVLFRSNFKTLLIIMLLPVFINLMLQGVQLLSMTSEALSQSLLFSILKVLVWLVSLYVGAISTLAVAYSIKNDTDAKESFLKATNNSIAYILIILFEILVIVGGSMLFIVPGILFSVWLSLTIYVFAFEDTRGLATLRRSKQLIQGNFWKIVWRSFIFMPIVLVILCIPFIILGLIFEDKYNLIGSGILLLIYPIILIFELLLYKNLVEIKKDSLPEEPKKIYSYGYYFAMVIAVPVFSAFVLLQALNLGALDIPNPDDSDLQLQVLDIPKEDNAFYSFLEVKDKIYLPEEKLNSDLDPALIQEILQKNEEALALLDKGVSLPVFQQPEFQNPKNYSLTQKSTTFLFLRSLAEINSIKALSLQKQGREKDALDQSMKTIHMAQMIQDSQGTLINYLVGFTIKEIGFSNFRDLIQRSNLQSSELLSYELQLDRYAESNLSLKKALKTEYVMLINNKESDIDPVFRGEKPKEKGSKFFEDIPQVIVTANTYFYQPNKTKLLFAQVYRGMINNADKNNYALITFPKKISTNWTLVFRDNVIGKILSNVVDISMSGLFERRFQENFSVKGTQLFIALKAYKQTTGNLPDSLTALVPSYLPVLPQDPFDGNAIRYSKEKGIIYSTGKDLIDDNGNISADDWRQGSDLGFKFEF